MNNDWISKFAIYAEKYAYDLLGSYEHEDYNKVRNEKFADMIINDCINIIEEESCGNAGAYNAVKRIKKELLK